MSSRFEHFSAYFNSYISRVEDQALVELLQSQSEQWVEILNSISEEASLYRYSPEKWSVREMVLHITDTERIMAYRALAFSRGEKLELPPFDENHYVVHSEADLRLLKDLTEEWLSVRRSTLSLFRSFSPTQLQREGRFSGASLNVEGIGYLIGGHIRHHHEVLLSRYSEVFRT